MSERLVCQRSGCTAKYLESENTETACQHHPGAPVFHDGLKGWSCCKKRVTEFSEFMTIPGCTWSRHTTEKMAKRPELSAHEAYAKELADQRATASKSSAADSAAAAAARPAPLEPAPPPKAAAEAAAAAAADDPPDAVIAKGAKCLRGGCKATFDGDASRSEVCIHHPGIPIFHDASKGWSCCKRKVMEFEEFLRIEGCCEGKHKFIPPPVAANEEVKCRLDFYQGNSTLSVSVYAKKVKAEQSKVTFEKQAMTVHLEFRDGRQFDKKYDLLREIDSEKCKFEILTTKVEITLQKAQPGQWERLEM